MCLRLDGEMQRDDFDDRCRHFGDAGRHLAPFPIRAHALHFVESTGKAGDVARHETRPCRE